MRHDNREGTTMVLKFEGIENSAEGKILSQPIDILAWSFGAGFGATEENETKAYLYDLSMTKYVSIHSPLLLKFISEGRMIKYVTLTSKNENQIITFKLQDVIVSNLSTGGSGGENCLTENITLNYTNITMIYEDVKASQTEASGEISNEPRFKLSKPRF